MGGFRDWLAGAGPFMRETPEEEREDLLSGIWPAVTSFWDETFSQNGMFISPTMADKVWVANRCVQLNAQQIASMPLRFEGSYEPAWVSNPDPNWYPNGIGDAVFAAVQFLYRFGFTILYVTSRYASGLPQTWTVLDSSMVNITMVGGRRSYKIGETQLDAANVVQIDRNPGAGLHGSSAIGAYGSQAWSLIASAELARGIMSGGVPTTVLKPKRKQTETQARNMQAQWVTAVNRRGGAPAVLPIDVDFEKLSFSPADLLLLEGQEWNARVLATAFGVPASLLNMAVSGGLTYQNPQTLGEQWWRFELLPTGKRITDAMTAQLLPRGNAVSFDASDTFAPLTDTATQDDNSNASPADQAADVLPIRQIGATA